MSEKYKIKLSAFEGPLDLLLHLISKAKIDIKDIFVSEITEQYLEYIRNIGTPDMDSASEFLQMAATLIYIKSRAMLPRAKQEDIDEDGLTPEERLIKKLTEYKRYKEGCAKLRELEKSAALCYYKLPEELNAEELPPIYVNADKDLLYKAFLQAMKKVESENRPEKEVKITKDSYSVKQQMKVIIARLSIASRLMFSELLSKTPGREEIAVTFLSLLELINKNAVSVKQDGAFSGIYITLKEKS